MIAHHPTLSVQPCSQPGQASAPTALAEVMNLLNEAMNRYPAALSFAAGRPPEAFLQTRAATGWADRFVTRAAAGDAAAAAQLWRLLGQYSDTNGVILDMAADYLRRSGLGPIEAGDVMVTNGAQEAILISLAGLAGPGRCLIAPDPTYVGVLGPAAILGTAVETLPDDGTFVERVEARAAARGRTPVGAVYVIADFANPSGTVMSLADRHRLVASAARHGFHVIEDAAYRRYRYDGEALPTLKSLDRTGRVVHIESFAKTLLPGLRLALLVADGRGADGRTLAQRLAWIKSYVSVATSPLLQASLAGFLGEQGGAIDAWIEPCRRYVGENRDAMAAALADCFAGIADVSWQVPPGGFFLRLRLPFGFGADEMVACAEEAGVIVMPMSLFSPTGRGADEVRLAFSNTTPPLVRDGIERLAGFVRRRCRRAPLPSAAAADRRP